MHPNAAFRKSPGATNIAFARSRAFGTLAVNAADGPLLAHVPFLLNEDGQTAYLHLVRSNPIVDLLDQPQQVVIAIAGPDSYISPDWYVAEDQVPTWNYIAVHLRGTLERLPQDEMQALLARQSMLFEERLRPKVPWTDAKMTEGVMDRMMRAIVPFRLTVAKIDGTWKLNQNKPDEVRLSAANQVREHGIGHEIQVLSDLMRAPPKT